MPGVLEGTLWTDRPGEAEVYDAVDAPDGTDGADDLDSLTSRVDTAYSITGTLGL